MCMFTQEDRHFIVARIMQTSRLRLPGSTENVLHRYQLRKNYRFNATE